jgi:hypothetical protein
MKRALLAALGALLTLALAGAASADETFTATAEAKNAAGAVRTAPVTISYTALSTPAQRDALFAALKSGGHAAAKKVLAGMKDIGFIEAGKKKVAVKYAFARPVGDGRMVTVVSSDPMVALKSDLSNTAPKAGYDLTLALLVLDANGTGTGEFTPAAKIKLRDDGALTTEDSSTETIWLKGVTKK